MHFDHTAQKDTPLQARTGALREAVDTAANELFERHGIFLQIFFAWNMSHYPGGTSPPFFEVDLSPDLVTLDYGKEIHGTVLQTIEKYFGHFQEDYCQRPIVRYTAKERDDFGGGFGLAW